MPRPRAPFLLRPSRRTLLLACILLLAGAIVNVAVAWTCAAWGVVLDLYPSRRGHGIGGEWPVRVPDTWPAASNDSAMGSGGGVSYYRALGFPGAGNVEFVVFILDAGVPMRSMRSVERIERTHDLKAPIATRASGVRIPSLFGATEDYFPTVPIPAGFALNTLFYAAILALPLNFFPIRRRVRARRGRCPACGYDLTGLADAAPCPECSAS